MLWHFLKKNPNRQALVPQFYRAVLEYLAPEGFAMETPVEIITITWIGFCLFIGLGINLVPALARILALGVSLVSAAYAFGVFLQDTPITLELLDSFGVTLMLDSLSGFFILTNALVTAAVFLYCWHSGKSAFFYAQAVILHGSVNAAFICEDFVSLYVALEVISIAAFLLMTYSRSDRSIWVGLRYLFVSNVAMLFYLVGAVLVYKAHGSFAFEGLRGAPPEAFALIFLGLLAKGGVMVSGLWLPVTHAESESPVSALMSGVVVKAGIFPLVRCALLLEEFDPIIRLFGVGAALFGVLYAIVQTDTKRTLAFSTLSQMGFVLAAPEVGGFYALTHGLVKATLFLLAGVLPSRNFSELQSRPLYTPVWIALVMASFSISGFPLLSGFGAKVLTIKNLVPWQVVGMNLAALGTAIAFAKFIFLPHQSQESPATVKPGFWSAIALLIGSLVVANFVYYEAYTLSNIVKPFVVIGLAWIIYHGWLRRTTLTIPHLPEQLDHLIGLMSVTLVLLFWIVLV